MRSQRTTPWVLSSDRSLTSPMYFLPSLPPAAFAPTAALARLPSLLPGLAWSRAVGAPSHPPRLWCSRPLVPAHKCMLCRCNSTSQIRQNFLVQSTLPAWNAYTRNYIDENLVTEPALSSSSAKLPLSATSPMLSELSS